MEKPLLISFIVPAFNAQATLAACIGSIVGVMEACGRGFEVIVIDDGSTDDTGRIASAQAGLHREVRVVSQDNCGLGAARNRGIREAVGEYIAFVDADDEISLAPSPDFAVLDAGYDVVAIPISRVLPSGCAEPYGRLTQRIPFGKSYAAGKDYVRHRNVIPCVCAYLWRREQLATRFSEGVFHEDEEFTVVALLRSGALACSDRLFAYRYVMRSGSITTSTTLARQRIADFRRIIGNLQAFARQNPSYRPYMRAKMMWLHFDYLRQLVRLWF